MKLAIIGCGYVSEFYAKTLPSHAGLELAGAWDRNAEHLAAFCGRFHAHPFSSFEELLADRGIELVLNLTNPRSHFEITKRCLEAGKHVYSEKPLAMTSGEAAELASLAEARGLQLASAPCSVLSETARTLWQALRDGMVGKVRLVYANFDDGMIAPRMAPWKWLNETGVPWPAKDEFEVGCTFEHAGYVLTWLSAFFGPAKSVTSFASCQIPDKGIPVDHMAPDFSVGCIEYADNIVARVTCGLVAPKDKSLTIVGDQGTLSVSDVRDETAPVYFQALPAPRYQAAVDRRLNLLRTFLEKVLPWVPWSGGGWHLRRKLPYVRKASRNLVGRTKRVDFCRGPAEMAAALCGGRASLLTASFGVHIVEQVEALQHPERFGGRRTLQTHFPAMEPPADGASSKR